MILIADSGSTKTTWLLGSESKPKAEKHTIGLSPYFVTSGDIEAIVREAFIDEKEEITHVYFYGTGCHAPAMKALVKEGLQRVFVTASIHVTHDLLACAIATCADQQGIPCIIGTGCNACVYDGNSIVKEMTSLGFMLGDEGSGTYFGKQLLRDYFYKDMPDDLASDFNKMYAITLEDCLQKIYKESLPNRYIASFSEFLSLHKDHPYCQTMARNGLDDFFKVSLLKFAESNIMPIHFVGSIAYHFQDVLLSLASQYHFKIGKIIKEPIVELYQYHISKHSSHA